MTNPFTPAGRESIPEATRSLPRRDGPPTDRPMHHLSIRVGHRVAQHLQRGALAETRQGGNGRHSDFSPAIDSRQMKDVDDLGPLNGLPPTKALKGGDPEL